MDSTPNIGQPPLREHAHKINNGYALIIHNRDFRGDKLRKGSEKDLDAIKIFCEEADMTIDIQENLRARDIRAHCRRLRDDKTKFRNYDGFVCFILSHGNSSGIFGVNDGLMRLEDIVSYFKESDDLLGKPKLFFIQACRTDSEIEDDSNETEDKKRLCPPDSSDILIAHSTIDGEPSLRHIRKGSWFIQTLMKQLRTHAQRLHLMDIMTVVNEDIAGSDLEGYRQMPIQVSTLTKFVYFNMATVANVTRTETRSEKTEGKERNNYVFKPPSRLIHHAVYRTEVNKDVIETFSC